MIRFCSFALVYLLIAIVLVGCAPSSKKPASINPDAKLAQITELASKSKGNVITLDDSTYNYYAISKPRPYSLVVFLTAAHPKFKCAICKQIDSEMQLVADSYMKSMRETGSDPEVFFLRLDYESASRVFQSYQVVSVPLVFHVGPHIGAEKPGTEYQISARDKFQVPSDPDAESLASFLSDRTGVSVKITRSMVGSYITLIVLFAILAALVRPVINSLPFWLRLIQWRPIWMIVSYGIYTCAISGLIFDIIRSPQMYYANPETGQIMFFYPQSGNQFVVEGFVIGFLNLACAISLILLTVYAPYLKNPQHRTMLMIGSVVMFIFCFRLVRALYTMKNPWYGRRY